MQQSSVGASGSAYNREHLPVLEQRTSRRKVTRMGLFAALGLGSLLSAVGTVKMLYPTKVVGFGTRVPAGSIADIRQQLSTQKYVVNQEGRFLILPAEANKAIAVYWKCVHLGCTVPTPNASLGGNMICPCHGSQYKGTDGDLIQGPATRPLDWMPITIEGGNVVVDTGIVNTRTAYESNQSTALM